MNVIKVIFIGQLVHILRSSNYEYQNCMFSRPVMLFRVAVTFPRMLLFFVFSMAKKKLHDPMIRCNVIQDRFAVYKQNQGYIILSCFQCVKKAVI